MSIWNKLGRSPGTLAVTLPSAKATTLPAFDPARLAVTVVELVDPAEATVGPAPASRDLLALCRQLTGELKPGYLALLPGAPALDPATFTIVDGTLRIAGRPPRDRPFVLLEIALDDEAASAASPLDRLADLAERRLQLHAALSAGDRTLAVGVFHAAIAEIEKHPALGAQARRVLVAGLTKEYDVRRRAPLGMTPKGLRTWSDFLSGLPGSKGGGFEALIDGGTKAGVGAGAVPAVHWNTRVLDGAGAAAPPALVVGQVYRVETKLDPAPADDAAGSHEVDAPDAGASVTFEIKAKQPVLRLRGDEAWGTRVEGTVAFDAQAGATEAVVAELRSSVAGAIALSLQLVTGRRVRSSQGITLTALAADQPAPAAPTQAAPVAVAGGTLTGPPVELRLEMSAEEIRASSAILSQRCKPASAAAQLVTLAKTAHVELVKLSKAYRADAARGPFGMDDGAKALAAMARIGADLHAGFFGMPGEEGDANLQRLATMIAEAPAGARVQIFAEVQAFPWALFYDRAWDPRVAPDDRDRVDPLGFWGHRFRMHRAIEGHLSALQPPVIAGRLRVHACLNRFIDEQQQAHGVQVVDRQRALFENLPDVDARPAIENDAALVEYLKAQPEACDLLYFFCHATAAQTLDALFTFTRQPADDQARLVLDERGGTTVKDMRKARPRPLDGGPLVVLNACGSVAGDAAFTSPLLLQFLARWRARGVLGTDWEVPTMFADAFAHRLVHHFVRAHQPLGDALAATSAEAFAAGNPFPLIYALYAPPELTFKPGATP